MEHSGARPEEGLEQAPCPGPRQLSSGGPRGGGVTPLLVAMGAPTAAPTPPSLVDRFSEFCAFRLKFLGSWHFPRSRGIRFQA